MKAFFSLVIIAFFSVAVQAQQLTADELLQRSQQFHDPMGRWNTSRIALVIHMEVPGRPTRPSKVVLDNKANEFGLEMVQNGNFITQHLDARDSATFTLNFIEPDSIMTDSLNLNLDRVKRWRDYYSYLYGLPMKLSDPGTIISPEVTDTQFAGQPVKAIKVTYDASVGSDIWYFYFHPETYAMVGYRFYHDEAANDGEYIVLSGMEIHKGIRIPKDRTWYMNADNKLLGTDYLKSFKVTY